MTKEKLPDDQENEGDYYLNVLGYADLADQPIPGRPGMVMRDFMDICGEHARPMLVGLDSIPKDDPRYEQSLEIIRSYIYEKFIKPEAAEG